MKIKSYFAESVQDAMEQARRELGPEAMIVQSRKAPPEWRHIGEYEVVFALAPAEPSKPEPEMPGGDRLSIELAEMRRQLESMRLAISRSSAAGPGWLTSSSELGEVYSSLVASGITNDLAEQLVESLHRAGLGSDRSVLVPALEREIEKRVKVEATLGRSAAGPQIVALVGPPGCGKTTTLIKLALAHGLAARRRVSLLSVDNYRVAAAEQLRSYAAILGVRFEALETVGAVAQALTGRSERELVLIDTSGYSFGDLDCAADLARFLSSRPEIDVQLVLSASMKSADLSRMVDAFSIFHPSRLLFTRLDETDSLGPVFCQAARTGKAMSFFGTGQRIPEDLEAASHSRLISRILEIRPDRVISAA